MSPPAASDTRLGALDGVRGLAALLVVTHNLLLIQTPRGTAEHVVVALLDRGWIGVQLFFVLSGFLITGILLDDRGERLGNFYARRVLRIFPLYYLTLLVVLVLLPAVGGLPASFPRGAQHERWYWIYLSNWVSPFHQGFGPFPHFWSLAIEEQFYLLWPLLVGRRAPRTVFALSLGVALIGPVSRAAVLAAGWPDQTAYQFTICRIDALALGAAAAAAWRVPAWSETLARSGPALLAAAAAVLLAGAVATHGYTLIGIARQAIGHSALALAFALALLAPVAAPRACGPIERALRTPALRGVGTYSYGLYVIHVPLHMIVGLPLLAALGYSKPYPLAVALAYIAVGTLVSLGVAVAVYHGVELRFLRLKRRFPRPAE